MCRCSFPPGNARFCVASSRSTSRPASPSARARSSSGRECRSRRPPCAASSRSSSRSGLLTHPHTSAGRMPTEAGYRLYAEELVDTMEGRPGELGVDLTSMRDELEEALRHDDRLALARDAAARARVRAVARDGDDPARRGARAPADERDGRRDHVDGRGHEARLPARDRRSIRASSSGPPTT